MSFLIDAFHDCFANSLKIFSNLKEVEYLGMD